MAASDVAHLLLHGNVEGPCESHYQLCNLLCASSTGNAILMYVMAQCNVTMVINIPM